MCLSPADALVLISQWPSRLSGKEMLELLRQLTTLDLPERDLRQWQKESQSTISG